MQSKETILERIHELKVQVMMSFSPIDDLLLAHDINMLMWVLEEVDE